MRGLVNKDKREQIFTWIKQQSSSITLLQETHSSPETADLWIKQWGNKAFFSGNNTRSCGVAVLLNSTFEYKIHNYHEIITGRLQALEIEINESL